jgi:hypothetical protein
VPAGRRVWVRIFGVPPQAWSFEGFSSIVKRFGALIKLDSQTKNQSRLDVARVLISQHNWSTIDAIQEVKMEAARFSIRVEEEQVGDIDLNINGISRSPSSDEVSSRSSVKGWEVDGAASDLGWRGDGASDEGSGDDLPSNPLGINQNQVPSVVEVVSEVREDCCPPMVTDLQKGLVGDVIQTTKGVLLCNKGMKFKFAVRTRKVIRIMDQFVLERGRSLRCFGCVRRSI